MATSAFRSLEPVLHARLDALAERRERALPVLRVARRVMRRRFARTVGGFVATTGALLAFGLAWAGMLMPYPRDHTLSAAATIVLLGSWGAGALAALVTWTVAGRWIGRSTDPPLELTGNAAVDLARVDALDPERFGVTRAAASERLSVATPMAAIALLTPLTLHWIVWTALGTSPSWSHLSDFGDWIGISGVLVGHSHLAVLVGGVRWAWTLRDRPAVELSGASAHWIVTLAAAVGLACLPGIVLYAIPPVLVAVTGLAFMPAAYAGAKWIVSRERWTLAAATT